MKNIVHTPNAPQAIGTYSQAVKVDNVVYLSGQIPLDPQTMQLVTTDLEAQIHQVFKNMVAVTQAAGGTLANIVKLTIFMTDLTNFPMVNTIMAQYFQEPYPARSTVGIAALPKGAQIEIEGIMVL